MNPVVDFFKIKFFKSCGTFSFGIYLFHPAAIDLIIKNEPYFSIFKLRLTFSILLSYFFGFLFYELVEKYLIKLADFLCKKIESFKMLKN